MFTRTTNSASNNSSYLRSFKSPAWPLAKASRLLVIAFLILTLFFDWFTPAAASSSDIAASTQAANSPTIAKATNTQANPTNTIANLPTSAPSAKTAQVQQNLGKLGLRFEENDGQFDPQVKFKAQGGGYTLWLTSNGAVFDVLTGSTSVTPTNSAKTTSHQPVNPLCQQNNNSSASNNNNKGKQPIKMLPAKGCPPPPTIDQHVAVRMTLDGANSNLQAAGQNQLEGKSNYFIGKDSTKWHTKVPSFANVSYSSVYPGIDLTYYGNQDGQLEYDFKVAPNADPNAITFNFEGADSVEIASNGDLILHTGKTEIHQPAPEIYQEIPGSNGVKSRTVVSGGYLSKGSNRVGFKLNGSYDHTKALVIDPLIYSTYLGGNDGYYSYGNSITVDSSGNVYVTGSTESTTFPTTQGAYQTSCTIQSGYSDCTEIAFVSKLNASGSNLVYSTYLGGSDNSNNESDATSIAVDNNGNAYVTGYTNSINFPTTQGAYQTSCTIQSGYNDCTEIAFVSKLNTTGSNLVYSTYLGGSDGYGSEGKGIQIDNNGAVYIAGETSSSNFPTTFSPYPSNCVESTGDRCGVAFVTKLNANGNRLIYSTYLDGDDGNSSFSDAIAIDSGGDAYVTGLTYSTNFPITADAYQSSCVIDGRSCYDVFVTELNPDGSSLIYSTYLGNYSSIGLGITSDSNGNVYVTGETSSPSFPTTPGAYQTSCIVAGGNCNEQAFVTKLNTHSGNLIYSTYLGGLDGTSGASGITVDSNGNAYVTGGTESINFPTTSGACVIGTYSATFITKLNAEGSGLIYSTCLSGAYNNNDYGSGSGITLDSYDNVYITGQTNSPNFPTTPDAYQTSCTVPNGQNECADTAFISKLSPIADFSNYHLQFDTQPVGSSAASPFATQPIISVRDTNNQIVQTYTGTVNIAILSGSGTAGATLSGSTTISVTNGVAAFTDLSIDKPGNYILQASNDETTNANSATFSISQAQFTILSGEPDFSAWDQDDLFTPAQIQSNSNSTTLNFSMGRYYGLVNPNNNKLIDVDPTTTGFTQQQIQNNAKLHDSVATLYLWTTGNSSSPQNITVNGSAYGNVQVVGNIGASSLISVPIQLSDLKFPNICTGTYATNHPNCLRDPNKTNGIANGESGHSDYEDPKPNTLSPVPNTITISSSGSLLHISNAYLFLNGIRPVLMMDGIEVGLIDLGHLNPFNQIIRHDTTNSWGDILSDSDDLNTQANHDNFNWIAYLSNSGIPNWNPPRDGSKDVDTQETFVQEGAKILYDSYGVKKINILSHSMGGIVTHQWISDNPTHVDDWITLDSPHGGVVGAGIDPSWDTFLGAQAQADLGSSQIKSRNAKTYLPEKWSITPDDAKGRVFLWDFYAYFKQDTTCSNNIWFICTDHNQQEVATKDDGLIEVKSGIGYGYTDNTYYPDDKNLPYNYATTSPTDDSMVLQPITGNSPNLCNHEIYLVKLPVPDLTCHKYVTISPAVEDWVLEYTNINNLLYNHYPFVSYALSTNNYSSKTTASVTNRIFGVQIPAQSKNTTTQSQKPTKAVANNNSQTLLNVSGTIISNTTISYNLVIDDISSLRIGTSASISNALTLTIQGNGDSTPAPGLSLPGGYIFPTVTPGNYQLIVNSSGFTETDSAIYGLLITATGGINMQSALNLTPNGSNTSSSITVTLNSSTSANVRPVTGAIVTGTVTLTAPDTGVTTTLTLNFVDSGTNGDATANDGTYTALLPSIFISQVVQADIYAQGSYNGNNFRRYSYLIGKAKSGELYFTGPYSWQTSTVTNTNFIGTTTLNTGVNVQQSGNFIVSAVLAAPDGTTVATSATTTNFNVGSNTVAIPFDMSGVWQSQLEGPYHISQLSAQYVGPNAVNNSDSLDDTSSLPQLNLTLSQLNRPFVLLNGAAISDTPLNPDSKGKYQTLQVTVPLDVAVSNVYSYSAVLRTQNGMPAGSVSGQVNLSASSNTPLQLNFPGSSIYASGQNGPYQVESLIVEDVTTGQVLLFVDNVGQTSNYQYTQFSGLSYTYYLPFLANSVGGYTSYLAFQNVGNVPANFSLQFYNTSGVVVGTPTLQGTCAALAANAECIPNNPFANNQAGSGVIVSDQPLNVIVAEGTPYGGSAYAVTNGGSNNLIAPLILKGAYGDFNTRLTIFNGGSSAASVAVTFYDQNGNVQTAANQSQAVAANTAWTLDQASSNLPAGFNGWAQITAPSGSQLVAQVLEQSQSRKFVAIANAQPLNHAATTLYAPAIFKGAFGFVTGANIVNPNSNTVSITISYYDDSGKVYPAPTFTLTANSIASIYQSASGAGLPISPTLPSGFSGAAVVQSTGGNVLMVVNESGGVSASGTSLSGVYSAASTGGSSVGLPVMANGGYGYTTGATILNTSSNTVNGTIQYYNPDGSKQGSTHQFTIGPNASQLVYQGDAAQGLSNGFYGTAIVTESGSGQDLIATTNAESGLFYTYTEPNN